MKIFGEEIIDVKCIEQLKNCYDPDKDFAVLTADAHYGYQHPIGGAVAYKDQISLSGVGFDIGCGNKAVKTNIKACDVDVKSVMDEIWKQISFGIGRVNNESIDHPILDQINRAQFIPQRSLLNLASQQLGTVGGGNHYVDLFEDDQGYLWIGVHFGSRGFGHKTTTGFIALSQGKAFGDRGKDSSMDGKPILFDTNSLIGQAYIDAMRLAGEYAYAGRNVVVDKILNILGAEMTMGVHNHHNFAWRENHFGESYWVVRKGCTPAFPGQRGFIGSNMYDYSVIVEGVQGEESELGLYSTVHGAGRVMSRNEAAGKRKWKNGEKIQVTEGKVNFNEVKERVAARGVELRGGGADESPECYKSLFRVLGYHKETIRIVETLKPIGVAMAGDGVKDPYKD